MLRVQVIITSIKLFFNNFLFYFAICIFVEQSTCDFESADHGPIEMDLLLPYLDFHGPRHSHRYVRDCQPAKYNKSTSESYPSHVSQNRTSPLDLRYFILPSGESQIPKTEFGHHAIISNPKSTVSILEPGLVGGCANQIKATVKESAKQKNCIFSVNAGFFVVSNGECLGNVVCDGRLMHDSNGVQNSHFGIKKDGSLFFGFIPEGTVFEDEFDQLVAGVVWLVRNGEVYIDVSKDAECPDHQTAGPLQKFIDINSARVAVGHDKLGRIHIVQVDGKTNHRGISLYEFADLLISFGIVNAINLDGGGSATAVLNGSVINYPADVQKIDNQTYSVERDVSTVLCVHDYVCVPADCSGHGSCYQGQCRCAVNWHGPACNQLKCGATNCSGHNGICSEAGCSCSPGWYGDECSVVCPPRRYGSSCSSYCDCPFNASCDPVNGHCICPPGFTGVSCESNCPFGRYGERCMGICQCSDGCFCDPITGFCESNKVSHVWQAGQCYGNLVIVTRDSTILTYDERRSWLLVVMILSAVSLFSMFLSFVLVCQLCRSKKRLARKGYSMHLEPVKTNAPLLGSDDFSDDLDSEFENSHAVKKSTSRS